MPLDERDYMKRRTRLKGVDELEGGPGRLRFGNRERRGRPGVLAAGYWTSGGLLAVLSVAHAAIWISPAAAARYRGMLDACPGFQAGELPGGDV